MRCLANPLLVLVAAVGCRGPAAPRGIPAASIPVGQESPQEPQAEAAAGYASIDYEHVLDTGIMLRSPDDGWGAHLMLPLQVGFTQFDLKDISLDHVTSLSVVPTVEVILPLDERWTLLPFVGLGGAVQTGDGDLVGGQTSIGLFTAGLQAMRWQPFAERYTSIARVGARYDAALTGRDGLLGDWGSADAVAEIRRAFGEAVDGSRFEPGAYAQGFWYWDSLELDIDGVTPAFVHNQLELGLSFGATEGFEILGIAVPRVFVGYRFGGELQSVQIRFGRL